MTGGSDVSFRVSTAQQSMYTDVHDALPVHGAARCVWACARDPSWKGEQPDVHADRYGSILDNPPLAEAIATDSILGDVRLVAWPGDARLLPREGRRGFPHWGRWLQRNLGTGADLCAALGPPPPGAQDLSSTSDAPTSQASALATRYPALRLQPLHIPLDLPPLPVSLGCCLLSAVAAGTMPCHTASTAAWQQVRNDCKYLAGRCMRPSLSCLRSRVSRALIRKLSRRGCVQVELVPRLVPTTGG